jgi:hypothetical protein
MKQKRYVVFWTIIFLAALLILSQIGLSDGDDAYFYEHTHEMGLFAYLRWRYETWVGRMTAEALVYITFHCNLWFWRIVNALMMVLLPVGVIRLALTAARVPKGSLRQWYAHRPACDSNKIGQAGLGISVAAVAGYFLMDVMTVGYAAIWVNGSIFYTWTFTCGIWALLPFAECVFSEDGSIASKKIFWLTIPLALIASMSIEQMGAVLLVFEALGTAYVMFRRRSVQPLLLLQTIVTLAAFVLLFTAPGNAIRVEAETATWMPQYDTMSFGEHLFITLHWLLSSFANENRLFLAGIWGIGILMLWQNKEGKKSEKLLWTIPAVIFCIPALLPLVGVTVMNDMGMQYIDITSCVNPVPMASNLDMRTTFVMIWWLAALLFTFAYLWKISGFQVTLLLAYLAGIASEAILYFSPTMYASGARVYYLTDWLFLFIILCLILGQKSKKLQKIACGVLAAAGIWNFAVQIWVAGSELL